MLDMTAVTREAVAAQPYASYFNPNWKYLFRGKVFKWVSRLSVLKQVWDEWSEYAHGEKTADEAVGDFVGRRIVKKATAPARDLVFETHKHMRFVESKDLWRKNGLGGRTFPHRPQQVQLVVVYHDANRAGPHVDVHIGRFSLVRRVPDDVYQKLRYNSDGVLTQASQTRLLDMIKDEINNNTAIPQNLDHTVRNAKMQWFDGDTKSTDYGSGKTRQMLVEDQAYIYKAYPEREVFEFYAPALEPHRGLYVYNLQEGDDKTAPVMVWGKLNADHPPFEDRLHLKNYHPEDFDEMQSKSDMDTSTAKYDGSSAYIVTNKKGTRIWSPRHSVRTGDRIEYTFMFPELAMHTSDEQIVAMGELLFRRDGWLEAVVPNWLLRPRYLPQAEGSGILNAHALRPRHVMPEIRLYRMDKIGRTKMVDLPFFENRQLQTLFAKTHPNIDVVESMTPTEAKVKGFEGIVTAPPDSSINEGYKLKWWRDPDDWKVTDIGLHRGDKGGIAGAVHFESMESGKQFKLGPGQMGDHAFNEEIMQHPDHFVGRVARVQSKHGHEGRASRLVGWHDDK